MRTVIVVDEWNMKIWLKVMEFVVSHGIHPILPMNFTKFIPSLPTLRNLATVYKVCNFQPFPQNVENAEFEEEYGYGKSRNNHRIVIEKSWKLFVQSLLEACLWKYIYYSDRVRAQQCAISNNKLEKNRIFFMHVA